MFFAVWISISGGKKKVGAEKLYLIDNQDEAERYKEHKRNLYQNCSDNVKLYQKRRLLLLVN
ncbi:hypothetical protein NCCP28_23520 [Niallia sp. NCCP-28]|nr:hypothetical protein NCCP28_23520 [Niallia sp. NCCP-28]